MTIARLTIVDLIKLGIYIAFFFMLLAFYGLPIHIMRDLFMTSRDFVKRLGALLRYRRAIKEMNSFPDATQEELAREDTCIICREEMRIWDPENNPGAIDRVRPKKLPCGHILHLGCLRGWLERQQMCPTCRTPVSTSDAARGAQNQAAGLRIAIGGGRPAGQQPPANGGDAADLGQQNGNAAGAQRQGGPRILNLGPLRIGFGANGQQVRELAQQFGIPQGAIGQGAQAQPTPVATNTNGVAQTVPATPQPMTGDNIQNIGHLLQQAEQLVQREVQSLQIAQQELQTIQLLTAELHRLRHRQQQQEQVPNGPAQAVPSPGFAMPQPQFPQLHHHHLPPQVAVTQAHGFPSFPAIPPRNPSPLMARHGAAPGAVPIPAGSSELPEGVVLPQGWSLLPLHRLDGQPSTQPSPQVGPQTTTAENFGAPQSAPVGTQTALNGSNTSQSTANVPSTEEQPAPQPTLSVQSSSSPTRSAETSHVIAPSPRMPNWGGSAQIFGDNSRLDQAESSAQTGTQSEASAARPDAAKVAPHMGSTEDSQSHEPSHTVQSSSSSDTTKSESDSDDSPEITSDKGKARAVTVEDADDGEDDTSSHREKGGVSSEHNS